MRPAPALSFAVTALSLLAAPPPLILELPPSAFDMTVRYQPPARRERARAASEPPKSPSIARTAARWAATVAAFLVADKIGAQNVDGDPKWFFKQPDATEGVDTWRNHATTGPLVGELPSTFHR